MIPPNIRDITRRHFFKQSGFGIGGLALSALLDETLFARQGPGPLASRAPHFAPKAKHIIYLFMAGAPTQLDLFDNKPALQQHNGEEIPAEFIPKGERFAFIKGTPRLRTANSVVQRSSNFPLLARFGQPYAPWREFCGQPVHRLRAVNWEASMRHRTGGRSGSASPAG